MDCLDDVDGERSFALVRDKPLFLLVEHGHVNLRAAEVGELNELLDDAPLALAEGD